MKVFMTGGTGFVGSHLARDLIRQGHQVTILTRKIPKNRPLPWGCTFVEGDPTEKGSWQEHVKRQDVLVNLAGATIFRRWTDSAKRLIRESRILTTRNLVEAASATAGSSLTLISTSAVGYYGPHGDEELDERSGPGNDFLSDLSKEWESAAMEADRLGMRVVITRFGVVLGRGEGALRQMVPIFKMGLGSHLGSGEQWFPWIHIQDLIRIYSFILEKKDIRGPINCTAPQPVRNKGLTKALGDVLHRPTIMPGVPGFMIRIILGDFGSVLLKGQKVLPMKLKETGFSFLFPEIRKALEDLYKL